MGPLDISEGRFGGESLASCFLPVRLIPNFGNTLESFTDQFTFFVWCPYMLLDVFFRGNINNNFAMK